ARGDTRLVQAVEQVFGVESGCPVGDQVVEFAHAGAAGGVGGIALVGGQFRPAHEGGEAGEHGVLVGGDEDEIAARGGVDVAGGHVRQHGAGAFALVAGERPFGQQR